MLNTQSKNSNEFLQSRLGEIKTKQDWEQECVDFYSQLQLTPRNAWERYQKVLGLIPIDQERNWDGRNLCLIYKEGLTKPGAKDV